MVYREGLLGKGDLNKVKYTSSLIDDAEIYKETILALITHVNELSRVGAINSSEAAAIINALRELSKEPYRPSDEYEDVHEYIEAMLIRRLGNVGGWVGLGRSRNDHVAAALRLKLRRLMLELASSVIELRRVTLSKAIETADAFIIGTTHRQPAQVTTLGHYMLYLDELSSDFIMNLLSIYETVNRSPLGSGPLAGTMVNLNRVREAEDLAFNGIVDNTVYATGSRYFMLTAASITVSYLIELGRFINNIEMWLMPQLNYVTLNPSHLATSSIMPHKRNPATLEVLRARIGEAVGHLMSMYSIERPVEAGYQLDLQEETRHAWLIMRIAIDGVGIMADLIRGISVNKERVKEDLVKYPVTAAEYAELMSISGKVPFRDAHREVAVMVKEGRSPGIDPAEAIKGKEVLGGPNPSRVTESARARLIDLSSIEAKVKELAVRINKAEAELMGG
ncbi:MAG: argininosuccinate lyase [Caldivirga sp.]|uniref:argininosuccinate lyase n=1 Tax=Caldivirga sp. TaxID=2080243 RepID=UPI003D14AD0F